MEQRPKPNTRIDDILALIDAVLLEGIIIVAQLEPEMAGVYGNDANTN